MKAIKIILLGVSIYCWSIINVYGQDIITKKDGTDIKAKVIEITNSDIKYRKFESLEGPIYHLEKSEILIIRYENGTKDIFKETKKNNKVNSNENAKIIIYRPKQFTGSFISYKLYCNNKYVAKIKNGTYIHYTHPAGIVQFIAKTEAKSIADINLKPAKTYYLKCTVSLGAFVGHPKLVFYDPEIAKQELAKAKFKTKQKITANGEITEPNGEITYNGELDFEADKKTKLRGNVFSAEFLFVQAFSANYERFIVRGKNNLLFRVGFGGLTDGMQLIIPFNVNFLTGNKGSHFEVGAGVLTVIDGSSYLNEGPHFWFNTGYRFQKPNKHFVFKANLNMLPFGDFELLPGITIGVAF